MTAENRDPSRLYGRASTFEGRRAVPSPEARDRLAEQRERLMSKNTKVGKTHYEAEGVSGMGVTADDTVTAKIAEWEALVPTEKWTLVGSTILSAEEGYVGQVSGLGWHDKGEFIAAAPAIATALLGFVREVRARHVREPYVDEPSEGSCRYCQRGGAAGTWPCATEQAAQKWFGGEA